MIGILNLNPSIIIGKKTEIFSFLTTIASCEENLFLNEILKNNLKNLLLGFFYLFTYLF
jgi:hypothetical protein